MNKKIGYVSAISVALLLASCYKPNKKKEPVVNETQEENLNTVGSEHKRKKRWLQPQTDENVKQGGDIPKLGTEKDSSGEVRANLPLSDGELTSGSIDLFYPLYDGDERILFGQAGARRFDGRSIVNLGIGQRHFQEDWAIGYNTFYDAQISGNAHQRLGIGLEYWRDYLHLAANGYFGLTDWHSSSALNGYAERVANGYDIRAQGWLPSYPQLSGKLKFEQYFGDDVALFNHQNRYKDPRVLTVGLDYTPIPLISLGVDRTFSHSGKDDTKVGLSFNYQLGVPLSQQIDPTTAPVRRTLADHRHRLVERNNNIVLKHRERSQLSLNLPTILSGFGGERKLINFSFNGKYRLKYIQWDDSVLRARGGRIVPLSDNSYAVHFPRYSNQQSNHLTISAMAHDEQGNVSNSSEMVILINEPVVLSVPVIEPAEDDESELVMRTGEGDEEPPLLEEDELAPPPPLDNEVLVNVDELAPPPPLDNEVLVNVDELAPPPPLDNEVLVNVDELAPPPPLDNEVLVNVDELAPPPPLDNEVLVNVDELAPPPPQDNEVLVNVDELAPPPPLDNEVLVNVDELAPPPPLDNEVLVNVDELAPPPPLDNEVLVNVDELPPPPSLDNEVLVNVDELAPPPPLDNEVLVNVDELPPPPSLDNEVLVNVDELPPPPPLDNEVLVNVDELPPPPLLDNKVLVNADELPPPPGNRRTFLDEINSLGPDGIQGRLRKTPKAEEVEKPKPGPSGVAEILARRIHIEDSDSSSDSEDSSWSDDEDK